MKKIISITVLILVVALSAFGLRLLFSGNSEEKIVENPAELTESNINLKEVEPSPVGKIGTTESFKKDFGKEESIILSSENGNITIPNFYRNASFVNKYGNADLLVTDEYTVSYTTNPQVFHVIVGGDDVPGAIKRGEEAFLSVLKISKSQACLLNVSVSVEKNFNTNGMYNNIRNLSFCTPK